MIPLRQIAGAITAGTLLIGAPLSTAAVRAGRVAAARHDPESTVTVSANDPRIVYLGRWGHQSGAATTVNSESRVLLRFTGRHVVGLFDQSAITFPPQVYARIDGSRPALYDVDRDRIDFAPSGLAVGMHSLELIVKDVDERGNRWVPPL